MGKHLLNLEAEARSYIALHEDGTVEATETILGFGRITPLCACSALLPSDIPDAPWVPDLASLPNS